MEASPTQVLIPRSSPVGGTFRVSIGGLSSPALPYEASLAVIDAALEALCNELRRWRQQPRLGEIRPGWYLHEAAEDR